MSAAAILLRDFPDLTSDAQRRLAWGYAKRRGLRICRVYQDEGRHTRLIRDAMLGEAGGVFSALVVAALPTLGRTLPEIVRLLAALHKRGVRVVVADGSEDDTALVTAAAMLQDAQERLRREAIVRGRERAKARGVKFGRPRLAAEKVERAQVALAAGHGVRAAARAAGISPASVVRLRNAARSDDS